MAERKVMVKKHKYDDKILSVTKWEKGIFMEFKYTVDLQNKGRTVRSILKNEFRFSHNLIKKFKYHGTVYCNRIPVYMNHIVETNDIIEAEVNFVETSNNVKPVKMDLCILYEDEYLIALDKPPGIIIHPLGINSDNTIANGLMHYFMDNGLQIRIRPVSRLDRDTTGVIVFSKNEFIHEKLSGQMQSKLYKKEYTGVVHGCPVAPSGTIDLPIARMKGSIILREVSEAGAPAITHYTVSEYLNNAAVVRFVLETGRTHQIRVHCRSIGHPLVGDTLYSDIPTKLISRQALHSHSVSFVHPVTGRPLKVSSPIPQDILNLLDSIQAELL